VHRFALVLLGFCSLIFFPLGARSEDQQVSTPDEQEWSSSPQYDTKDKVFRNQVIGDMNANIKFWSLMHTYIFGPEIREPSEPLPIVKPDWNALLATDHSPIKWIWFGHSGLYLNIKGTRVLIDAVLGASASPVPFMIKRFQAPIAQLEELPEPDIILISHDHYDHLDANLIKHFAHSKATFVTALAVGKQLQAWGVPAEQIFEFDWYQSKTIEGLEITAAPAQHFSGRGLFDRNKTLWASWILAKDEQKIYYSGDTGYAGHFSEIGRRYGPFQLAFLECGQYNPQWLYVHMMPFEVLKAAQELGTEALVPVHWGSFNLSTHDWFEPIEHIYQLTEKAQIPLWHPKLGELVRFPGLPPRESWWRSHPDFIKRNGGKQPIESLEPAVPSLDPVDAEASSQ